VERHNRVSGGGAVVTARLVPELCCSDFARSLAFYTEVLGFTVRYQRPEERFAYLDRAGASIMIEQSVGRAFLAAPLEYPYGRGINFQIEVADVNEFYARVIDAGCSIYLSLEEKWYRRGTEEGGNHQFIVLDPDGYLLRFAQYLGARPLS
jgi:catechol 2,3-dioxygenase-like lactoylglutathione lyase family enzyme